jgi:hypothetical protein
MFATFFSIFKFLLSSILGFHIDSKLIIPLSTRFILSFIFILPILHMKIFLDSLIWRVRPVYIMIFYALRRRNLRLIRHADRMEAARNSYRKLLEYLLKNKRDMALMKLELRLSRWCPILPLPPLPCRWRRYLHSNYRAASDLPGVRTHINPYR